MGFLVLLMLARLCASMDAIPLYSAHGSRILANAILFGTISRSFEAHLVPNVQCLACFGWWYAGIDAEAVKMVKAGACGPGGQALTAFLHEGLLEERVGLATDGITRGHDTAFAWIHPFKQN